MVSGDSNRQKVCECLRPLNRRMTKETHPETKKLQSLFLMAVWEFYKRHECKRNRREKLPTKTNRLTSERR